jgi:hypothetical protein
MQSDRFQDGSALRVLLLVGALALLLFIGSASRAAAEMPSAPSLQEPEAELALIERHAPIVFVRQQAACAPGGPYEPVPVEIVLGNPAVALRSGERGHPIITYAPTAEDVAAAGEDAFLDYPGNAKRPGCQYERDFLGFREGLGSVVYGRVAREEGREGLVVQYWFFYYFNDWNNNHEGDWEMSQVQYEESSAAEAVTSEPVSLAYSQHGGGETADWNDEKVSKEGDRPAVYVVVGAHANKYEPALFLGRGEGGTGFGCDDARGPHRRLDVTAVPLPRVEDASGSFAWLAWEGRWGERQDWEFNGPTGPIDKSVWREPISWAERQRDSSLRVPGRETLGPNAVDAFCDVVAFASGIFAPALRYWPILVAVGVIVVAGSVSITARRTTFRPAAAEPLQQRRRFGQLLIASAAVYRQHWGLMISLGALLIPLGIMTAAIHVALSLVPPFDPWLDLFGSDILARLAIALAVGSLELSIGYAIVLAGVTGALRSIQDRGASTVEGALAALFPRLWTVVRARTLAIVVTVGAALTVIGIPLAVNRSVAWTFVEQAVILDDRAARDSMRSSAALVRGQWRRVLGITLCVLVVGVGTGPAVGFALLLFSDASLIFVNVISSLIYAILAPYVGILLTLLYYDLRLGKSADSESEM